MLDISGLESHDIDELISCSAEWYGSGTYQATRDYLNWIYAECPTTNGLSDCLIAKVDGRIVGFCHKFILPGHFQGRDLTIAVMQNINIDKAHRGATGILLTQKIGENQDLVIVPGVGGDYRNVHLWLQAHETPSFWFRRILSPISVAKRLIAIKAGYPARPVAIPVSMESDGLAATARPTPQQIARLTDIICRQSNENSEVQLAWTPELVSWRYFSEIGPKHYLVESKTSGSIGVVSIGVRKGFKTARIVELHIENDERFLKQFARLLRATGAELGLAFTTYPAIRDRLVNAGWPMRKDPPASFTNGNPGLKSLLKPSAAATDVGFEAILTKLEITN